MSNRPNLILILADDMGFSDIGCFGSEISTPHLDALGTSGVRFSQLYNCARCCPSRASILTGLSAHQAGIGHMVDDWGVGPAYQGWLRDDTVTLAEALRGSGYRTLYSGKWHVNWSFEADAHEPVDKFHHRLGEPGYPHPEQRGFDESYALMAGATSLFNPHHMLRNGEWVDVPQPGYYFTDAITDEALGMIDTSVADEAPFFLHLSHVAPHWPLQAWPDDIARYKDTYQSGWDTIRAARHERLQKLGVIDNGWTCSPRDAEAPAWDSLDADRQRWEAHRMAVYAAMVDRLDQSIGRVVQRLEELGQRDNTAILFMSDNGGSAELLHEDGWCQWYNHPTHDGRPLRLGNDMSIDPGPDDTFASYDLPWANVSNTPFRLYKHFVHEGGIATPALLNYPAGMSGERIVHEACHVEDILPTFLDLADVALPDGQGGTQIPEGVSFRGALEGNDWQRGQPLCFEHEGNAAIRDGRYKAVRRHPGNWELYDMGKDRTELNDLAASNPEKLEALKVTWENWAARVGVRDWPPGEWPAWLSEDLRSS